MGEKMIRTNLTFTFDDASVSPDDVKERLDQALTEAFGADVDVHTRWVSDLAESPLFGAALQPKKGKA